MGHAEATDIHDLTAARQFSAPVMTGQAAYTASFLDGAYDLLVHTLTNHLTWSCPTKRLVDLYDRNVSADHLDVGVGTGLLLTRCRFPSPSPRVALMDLNENALRAAAARIATLADVTLYRANVLDPIPLDARFDSIGLVYLLHCLPGRLEEKGAAIGHLGELLKPRGVLFGATILSDRYAAEHLRTRTMAGWLRKKGVFANADDTLAGLETALRAHFTEYHVETVGSVALFTARKP